jgi:hypothetical protein
VWLITGFLFCPCHFPITLWLLASLVTTTALKQAIEHHRLALALIMTGAWLLASIRGILLMRNASTGRHRSAWLLLVLFVAGTSTTLQAQQIHLPSAEDSVRAAEQSRKQALLKADTVLLSRLTAAEFYEVNRFGQIRPRATNMQEIATGALKLKTVNYDSLLVHVYGDVGILTGIADNTGEFRGTPFSGKIRYTRVFVRRDGRWQAVSMQHTPIP